MSREPELTDCICFHVAAQDLPLWGEIGRSDGLRGARFEVCGYISWPKAYATKAFRRQSDKRLTVSTCERCSILPLFPCRSVDTVISPHPTIIMVWCAKDTIGVSWYSVPVALAHLQTLLEKRTPRHRRGFLMWAAIAPLTTPFIVVRAFASHSQYTRCF